MKKILGVTGIRSEYDIMSSVFRSIQDHPKLSLKLVVTGAHLSNEYGYTIEQIRKDGFDIVDTVPSLLSGDTNSFRVKGLAIQLQSIIQTVERINPDFKSSWDKELFFTWPNFSGTWIIKSNIWNTAFDKNNKNRFKNEFLSVLLEIIKIRYWRKFFI